MAALTAEQRAALRVLRDLHARRELTRVCGLRWYTKVETLERELEYSRRLGRSRAVA